MSSFTIDKEHFLLNNEPFRILSGAMHYFRVHPVYWGDRLRKMRAMGLNTLETYVAWNLHEPKPAEFNFDGWLDIVDYIKQAADSGLRVIVRPGPYICSEWDLGGLPAWLLKDREIKFRCAHEPYLEAVDRYFDVLLPRLEPLQISRGGPIIAMQIENEYGAYGNDKEYLRYLEKGMRARGINVLLFTSDGPTDDMLCAGTLPHILKTANFGSDAKNKFAKLREYQPEGPLMCMEFWNGWFDHWGGKHHVRTPEDTTTTLDEILFQGGSVNFYMFHGGTNFGFMNGSNCHGKFESTITSYDYDVPLNEAGDITPKYLACRKILGKYVELPDIPLPSAVPKLALGPVELTETAGLFDALDWLSKPIRRPTPEPMEMFGQNYGFILYRTRVEGPRSEMPLRIQKLHDRAQVFVDGDFVGVLEREFPEKTLNIVVPPEGLQLEILVENMGRVSWGPKMYDRKGITDAVSLGDRHLFGWTIFPLPLDDLSRLEFSEVTANVGPVFCRGEFAVTDPKDTFLALDGWTKGVCWINGFNLGRYWKRGPQQTLYVPGPVLRKGKNEIIIFELQTLENCTVEFRNHPVLNRSYPGNQ
ncbi:MAG: beta-galactosidase [FCB group bacterium]|nr:beta-galactosidase [FCB group bacterium]